MYVPSLDKHMRLLWLCGMCTSSVIEQRLLWHSWHTIPQSHNTCCTCQNTPGKYFEVKTHQMPTNLTTHKKCKHHYHTFCLAACSATMSLRSSFCKWLCCSFSRSSYLKGEQSTPSHASTMTHFWVTVEASSSSSLGSRDTSTPSDNPPDDCSSIETCITIAQELD